MRALAPLLAIGCSLAGCWSAHVYGERGTDLAGRKSGYGYSDVRLDDTTWEVSYTMGTREEADRNLLYRCAEITDSSGYDYFITSGRFSMGVPDDSTGYRERRGGGGHPTTSSTRGALSSDITSSVRIILVRGAKPQEDPDAHDAREVLRNIGPKLGRP